MKNNKRQWCRTCSETKLKSGQKCMKCKTIMRDTEKPYTVLDYKKDIQRFIDGKPLTC